MVDNTHKFPLTKAQIDHHQGGRDIGFAKKLNGLFHLRIREDCGDERRITDHFTRIEAVIDHVHEAWLQYQIHLIMTWTCL